MSVPQPATPLEGHCSAIDNDTLYVLSPSAFQSLNIKQNATWMHMTLGQTVNDPACAKAVTNDERSAALYVVGGSTTDDSYNGLQRYFFGNQSWETLSPLANVLQGRTNHSVAYLNDSQSILVYAGSQPDAPSVYSSQTFLIRTYPPYNVESFTSEAPPLTQPILEPFNSSHAIMVGGSASNTDVWTFGPDDGWQRYGTDLSQPLDPAARATIVDGTDGSKVLQVYNMSASPNTVTGVVLRKADGSLGSTGQVVGSRSTTKKRKRDLTLNDWPQYNSTNAPTATRPDCSLARDSSGLVAIAGGSSALPVALFNQDENTWVDAGRFFNGKDQQPLQPSPTSVINPATSTSLPTTAPGTGDGSGHARTLRTLGIVLGVICGVAALFILILLLLRWRRIKATRQKGYVDEKNGVNGDRMSFADRGASFMKEAGVSSNELSSPRTDRYRPKHDSSSSMAIMGGKFGNKRNTSNHAPKMSSESTAYLVKDKDYAIGPEPVEMVAMGERPEAPNTSNLMVPGAALSKETKGLGRRSSGWSRYFATSQPSGANGLGHIPSVYVQPNTYSVESPYTQNRDQPDSRFTRIPSSNLAAPLDIDFSKTIDGQRLSHVASGSPAFADSREDLARVGSNGDAELDRKASIVDPHRKSQATSISSYGDRSTLSSNITGEFYNTSSMSAWSPMNGSFKDHLNERPSSSIYANSLYDIKDRPRPSRGKSPGFFPGTGTSYRPSTKAKMSHTAGPTSDWAAPASPPQAQATIPAMIAEDRDSTASAFTKSTPNAIHDKGLAQATRASGNIGRPRPRPESKPVNTDMSWLNLGLNKNQA